MTALGRLCPLLVLVVLPVPSAGAQPRLAEAPALAAWAGADRAATVLLEELVEEADLPGISAAVAMDGEVVWARALGFADLERRVAATPETRYRIGSVGKPVTAAAAARLHQEGRLDLDAPIGRYLPPLPEPLRRITARQLAGHLGGIRHYAEDESQIVHRSYASVGEALERFVGDSLLHPPGRAYEYSSYGYTLLSAVIEAAAGSPFLTHMRSEVFPALGMERTVADHVDSLIADRAALYRESEADGRLLNAPATDNSYKWAAGGYLSTAADLSRFASRLAAGRWVGEPTLAELFAPMVTTAGDTTGYAMGWRPRTDWEGRAVVHHGGSSVGGRAFLLLYPESTLAVAILVNASRAPMFEQEAQTLAHLFLDHAPSESSIGAPDDTIVGGWQFTAGKEEIGGTLWLTGSRLHPGWMEWEGAARPVPIVLVDRHDDETRLIGAGVHGVLNLWADFPGDSFAGRWDWLGETSRISGRRVESLSPPDETAFPRGWTAVADSGDTAEVRFVTMIPGWHLHPGPSALVYRPSETVEVPFRVEMEALRFPGEPSGYGIFVGGPGLGPGSYDFLEVLLDARGRYRVGRRIGAEYHEIVPWTEHETIAVPTADGPGRNVLVVEARSDRLVVTVNGVELTSFEPPSAIRFDGVVGIRALDGVNLHLSRLDNQAGTNGGEESPDP